MFSKATLLSNLQTKINEIEATDDFSNFVNMTAENKVNAILSAGIKQYGISALKTLLDKISACTEDDDAVGVVVSFFTNEYVAFCQFYRNVPTTYAQKMILEQIMDGMESDVLASIGALIAWGPKAVLSE